MLSFESDFAVRHPGIRWKLLFDASGRSASFAVSELQRGVQSLLPYVLEVSEATEFQPEINENHLLLLGTPDNNPWLDELKSKGELEIPNHPEGYTIRSMKSPWNPDLKIVIIAGNDSSGVLYGVEEFNSRWLGLDPRRIQGDHNRKLLDNLQEFTHSDWPRIQNRGIWTWGYVIYDYRNFIDNMARLRMNTLTIWNDCPPINIAEIIDYAHSREVNVILGFHWGWGFKGVDLGNPEHVAEIKRLVLSEYEKNYAGLDHDGIYFQTLTETAETKTNGRPIAELSRDLVNDIARTLLESYPNLRIEFGLHASSIQDNYSCLEELDERVTITWEDAGAIPYSYNPELSLEEGHQKYRCFALAEETLDYSKKLAEMRDGSEFSMVPKGFTALCWATEFENHGPFILGERSKEFIAHRLSEKQKRWDYVNGMWFANYSHTVKFFKEILDTGVKKTSATALIEDGMFEAKIQASVALFAQILWNPCLDLNEYPKMAFSNYYEETN